MLAQEIRSSFERKQESFGAERRLVRLCILPAVNVANLQNLEGLVLACEINALCTPNLV